MPETERPIFFRCCAHLLFVQWNLYAFYRIMLCAGTPFFAESRLSQNIYELLFIFG